MDTLHLNNPRVKMVAHRGLSGFEQENTCAAFVAAGCRSYFGIETDIHRTADGQFIVIHDDNTRRVAKDEMIVEKTTFETLSKLRLCDKDGKRGRRDLTLPTLQDYIRICKKYDKTAVLELKNQFEGADLDAVIDIIRGEGWLERTIFISFALFNMTYIRQKLPTQKVQFLMFDFPDWLLDTLKEHHLDLDISYKAVTPEIVQAVHAIGAEINVWTVDKLEDAQRMAEYGVDYITSNIIE